MRSWLVLSAVFAVCHGTVDWMDFRAGKVNLPTKEDDALSKGWKLLEKDDTLKVSWYSQVGDPRLLLAFDQLKNLAGCKAVFLKDDLIGDEYNYMYLKGLFEEATYLGKPLYYSTVLFTAPKVLQKGGRKKTENDEVAAGVYVKINGKYELLYRNGCDNFRNLQFYEQGCENNYGLVSSKFGRESKCESMMPFYAIYDPQGKGDLMGFGWLSYSKYSEFDYPSSTTYYKSLTPDSFKALFPNRPACLANYFEKKGLTGLDVFLSYTASQGVTSCSSGGSWVDSHCQRVRSKKGGGDEDF